MAEIKPYSFEERKTMFTRIKMSAEEEINELRIEGNKRKNVYDARRSIEEAVNKNTFVFSRC